MKDIKFNIFILIMWTAVGMLTMVGDYVSKLNYGIIWAVLIMYITADIFKGMSS